MNDPRTHTLATLAVMATLPSCSDDSTLAPDPPNDPVYEWVSTTLRDYEFEHSQFFFLQDPDGCPWRLEETSLRLYVDDQDPSNDPHDNAEDATATPEGNPPVPEADDAHDGRYRALVPEEDFRVHTDMYTGHPVVELTDPLRDGDYLATVFRGWRLDWNGSRWVPGESFQIGTYDEAETTPLLKMVRPSIDDRRVDESNLRTGVWGRVSRLELRNVYDLSGPNIKGLQVSIHIKGIVGPDTEPDHLEDGTPFLSLVGLDLSRPTEEGLQPGRDDQVDLEFVDLERGLLMLPDLRPFDPDGSDLCLDPADCGGVPYCRFDPDSDPTKASRPQAGNAQTWMVLDSLFYRAPGTYDVSLRMLESSPEEYSRYELRALVAR